MTSSPDRMRHLKNGVFSGNSVLYWMVRDKRVNDNWALIEAQRIALKNNVPLIVCFNYYNKYSQANNRHYQFLFDGLKFLQILYRAFSVVFLKTLKLTCLLEIERP